MDDGGWPAPADPEEGVFEGAGPGGGENGQDVPLCRGGLVYIVILVVAEDLVYERREAFLIFASNGRFFCSGEKLLEVAGAPAPLASTRRTCRTLHDLNLYRYARPAVLVLGHFLSKVQQT